ncbi:MAG: hypothetical protein IT290_07945 [Deltaproteobacteria bacterium]|nr:hypothetical protein [Deltaproteobacteria bacterium]
MSENLTQNVPLSPLAFGGEIFVWILLLSCGLASIFIFLWVLNLSRKSAKETRRAIEEQLDSLRTVHLEALRKLQKLDIEIVDRLRPVSPKGSEAYSMAKQIHTKIARRIAEVEKLAETQTFDDLLKAQEILSTPIDNTGNQFDTLVFADTILTLQPDQCSFALDLMMELVERDLDRSQEEIQTAQSESRLRLDIPSMQRQRKFTVRGFFKSLMGPN